MQTELCWLCDSELTHSKEHIIPASLGGVRTVRGFLCRNCNSTTGHEWDAEVSALESWKFKTASDLRVNPQMNKPIKGRMEGTGDDVTIGSGFKVALDHITKREIEEGVFQFSCDPSQKGELFEAVNKLLGRKGQKQLTRDEFEDGLKRGEKKDNRVNFGVRVNLPKYYRSVVKTAMAMAFSLGIQPVNCENALRYLREQGIDEAGVVATPGLSLAGVLDDWPQYHGVTILGFPRSGNLFGEVMYFGNVAGLVILSDSYVGPDVISGHYINLASGEYVDPTFNVPNMDPLAEIGLDLVEARIAQFRSPLLLQMLES